jgi:hypothetical protein
VSRMDCSASLSGEACALMLPILNNNAAIASFIIPPFFMSRSMPVS